MAKPVFMTSLEDEKSRELVSQTFDSCDVDSDRVLKVSWKFLTMSAFEVWF
jgi:hypothetical protein